MELDIDQCIYLGTQAVQRAVKDYVSARKKIETMKLVKQGVFTDEVIEQINQVDSWSRREIERTPDYVHANDVMREKLVELNRRSIAEKLEIEINQCRIMFETPDYCSFLAQRQLDGDYLLAECERRVRKWTSQNLKRWLKSGNSAKPS